MIRKTGKYCPECGSDLWEDTSVGFNGEYYCNVCGYVPEDGTIDMDKPTGAAPGKDTEAGGTA